MALQFREAVEGIDAVQLTGVDEAHKQIAHLRAVQCFVERCILAMQQSAFRV